MFGSIPEDHIHAHDWRRGVTRVGSIPAELVSETTDGIADWDIPIDLKSGLDRPRTASLVWSPLLMPPFVSFFVDARWLCAWDVRRTVHASALVNESLLTRI
jgi:hypothetical protein